MPVVAVPISTPPSLRAEHEELRRELVAVAKLRGHLGEAAQAVVDSLHSHLVKEEKYTLPLLGALPSLAAGKIPPNVEEIRSLAERLETELGLMVREHCAIVTTVKRFAEVAHQEERTDLVQLAIKLKLHVANEEEVLYPAAVLVGKYLNHVKPAFKEAPTARSSEQDVEC